MAGANMTHVDKKLTDAMAHGAQTEIDFEAAALAAAWEVPMVLGSEDTRLEVLPFPNKGSAQDLYGLREGETIADAILRSQG
jgi:hypothetical protein